MEFTNDILEMFENPKFLNGLSIASGIAAIGTAVWGTNAAIKKKQTTGATGIKFIFQSVPYYIPTIGLEAVSIATRTNALSIQESKTLEAVAFGTLAYRQLIMEKEANKKILESEFGPKKMEKIEAKKTEEIAKMVRYCGNKEVHDTGEGDQLFYDVFTDQYFMSSYEAVMTHFAELDRKLVNGMWVDIDDYCDTLNIPRLPSGVGQQIGFSAEFVNKIPIGSPNPDWAWLDGRRETCGFIQFDEAPTNVHQHKNWY